MNSTSRKIKEYLLSSGVNIEEMHHESVGEPIEYSHKIGTRLEQQARALLLRCKKNGGEKISLSFLSRQIKK